MAMRFCILGSGSSGNAAFLQTDETRILIDAGFSARRLGEMLAAIGESLERLDAIFLTHEHGDHATGLTGLKRLPELKVFASAGTAAALSRTLDRPVAWQVFETGSRFRFRDLTVDAFPVPHDAAEPVGFVFDWGHDGDLLAPRRRLGWLTDLGHLPQQVRERVRGVDLLVLEANYDQHLLQADTKRPWSVKQRISGRHGHLSNQDACAFLAERHAEASCPREVFLAHLSRDCNSLEAVAREFATFTASTATVRFRLTPVAPGTGSAVLEWA
jgi:phosphoribosyl 1,2-cyclic phosphodiesterase